MRSEELGIFAISEGRVKFSCTMPSAAKITTEGSNFFLLIKLFFRLCVYRVGSKEQGVRIV